MTAKDARFLRSDPRAGWARPSDLVKGPGGRNLCRQCGQEVGPGRRTFCGEPCIDAWKVRTDPTHARQLVWKRDRGVCATCRVDTCRLERLRRRVQHALHHRARQDTERTRLLYGRALAWMVQRGWIGKRNHAKYLACWGWGYRLPDGPLWEMDHIVPVSEGGGSCGLENLRTLCRPCHVRVTAELRRRLAGRPQQPRLTP